MIEPAGDEAATITEPTAQPTPKQPREQILYVVELKEGLYYSPGINLCTDMQDLTHNIEYAKRYSKHGVKVAVGTLSQRDTYRQYRNMRAVPFVKDGGAS